MVTVIGYKRGGISVLSQRYKDESRIFPWGVQSIGHEDIAFWHGRLAGELVDTATTLSTNYGSHFRALALLRVTATPNRSLKVPPVCSNVIRNWPANVADLLLVLL